jgi:hypothetical protein
MMVACSSNIYNHIHVPEGPAKANAKTPVAALLFNCCNAFIKYRGRHLDFGGHSCAGKALLVYGNDFPIRI